jgi:hypothetical protein
MDFSQKNVNCKTWNRAIKQHSSFHFLFTYKKRDKNPLWLLYLKNKSFIIDNCVKNTFS